MQQHGLKALLEKNHITQRELARGIGKSPAVVSRMLSGELGMSKETIDEILAFLRERLGRRVTYERVFGKDEVTA